MYTLRYAKPPNIPNEVWLNMREGIETKAGLEIWKQIVNSETPLVIGPVERVNRLPNSDYIQLENIELRIPITAVETHHIRYEQISYSASAYPGLGFWQRLKFAFTNNLPIKLKYIEE